MFLGGNLPATLRFATRVPREPWRASDKSLGSREACVVGQAWPQHDVGPGLTGARAGREGEEHVNREGLGPVPMWRVTTHPLITAVSGFVRRGGSRG